LKPKSTGEINVIVSTAEVMRAREGLPIHIENGGKTIRKGKSLRRRNTARTRRKKGKKRSPSCLEDR